MPQRSARPAGAPAEPLRGLSAARLALGLGLAALLIGARLYDEEIYAWLDAGWHHLSGRLPTPASTAASSGLQHLLERPHSVPAVLLYAMGYVALCFSLLYVLVPSGEGWRWGLRLYIGVGVASGLLLLASRVGGLPVLGTLASRFLHGLLSPLPVMVLVPLLRGQGAQAIK